MHVLSGYACMLSTIAWVILFSCTDDSCQGGHALISTQMSVNHQIFFLYHAIFVQVDNRQNSIHDEINPDIFHYRLIMTM